MEANNKKHIELKDMLERFINGDTQAFDEIYKRCYGHVAFVCSKLCTNKEDIEEIVQDTFMEVFKKAKELRSDTFLALLRKIAARMCYKKRKANQHQHLPFYDEIFEMADQDQDFLPEEYLKNKETSEELLAIISGLPQKQREVIYLYYYADINTEEIARLHNCPPGNVRKTLHVARKSIKSKMTAFGAGAVAIATVLLI